MATGLASRVIFRLMAGALVQAGDAPSAHCPSRKDRKPLLQELGGGAMGALPAHLMVPCDSPPACDQGIE